jgi:hypothetical protein
MVAHVTSAAGVDKTGEKPCKCGVGLADHKCNQDRETGLPSRHTGKMGPICPEAFRERERLRTGERRLIVAEKKKLEATASQAKAEEDAWLEAHSQAAAAAATASQAKAEEDAWLEAHSQAAAAAATASQAKAEEDAWLEAFWQGPATLLYLRVVLLHGRYHFAPARHARHAATGPHPFLAARVGARGSPQRLTFPRSCSANQLGHEGWGGSACAMKE